VWKKEKNYLGFYKFKILTNMTKKKIIALGGINLTNLKRLKILNISGFAAIGLYKNKG